MHTMSGSKKTQVGPGSGSTGAVKTSAGVISLDNIYFPSDLDRVDDEKINYFVWGDFTRNTLGVYGGSPSPTKSDDGNQVMHARIKPWQFAIAPYMDDLGLDCIFPSKLMEHFRQVNIPDVLSNIIIQYYLNTIISGNGLTNTVSTEGKVYSWQKEFPHEGISPFENKLFCSLPPPTVLPFNINIKSISNGLWFTIALDYQGQIYSWGFSGCLGFDSEDDVKTPTLVPFFAKTITQTKQDKTNPNHNNNLDNTLDSINNNDINNNTSKENEVCSFDNESDNKYVESIACGWYHSLVLCKNGSVYSFGGNGSGELGYSIKQNFSTIPKQVLFFDQTNTGINSNGNKNNVDENKSIKMKMIACGKSHSISVSENGYLYGWGRIEMGHNGNDILYGTKPVKINEFDYDSYSIQDIISFNSTCVAITINKNNKDEYDNKPRPVYTYIDQRSFAEGSQQLSLRHNSNDNDSYNYNTPNKPKACFIL